VGGFIIAKIKKLANKRKVWHNTNRLFVKLGDKKQ